MTDNADIELKFSSNPCYLSVVREAITRSSQARGFEDCTCGKIMLAVDEAVSNVIRHGYDGRHDQPIWVRIGPADDSGDGLKVVIEDRARQVDPETIRGRDLDQIRPGGLGVHLIREMMDSVSYEFRDGGGMRLTLIKYGCCNETTTPASPSTEKRPML